MQRHDLRTIRRELRDCFDDMVTILAHMRELIDTAETEGSEKRDPLAALLSEEPRAANNDAALRLLASHRVDPDAVLRDLVEFGRAPAHTRRSPQEENDYDE